jgi:fructokinase
MADILTLGELLIDFLPTESGVSLAEASGFVKAPGGAPANVAAGLARLGVASGFIGKVSDDEFGRFLVQTLADLGVDTAGVHFSPEARTMLAFVSLRADGEREFVFYRHPSADMLLRPEEIDRKQIRAAKALHFGSISLIDEPARSATLAAAETARESELVISYDPNLRLALWEDEKAARQGMLLGWDYAHLAKVSREELSFLSGEEDTEAAARRLWTEEMRLLVITDGRAGCHYITANSRGHLPGYDVDTVDTTGAGDAFVAGLLAGLLENEGAWASEAELRQVLRFANACGALATTKRGAIPALPNRAEALALLEEQVGTVQTWGVDRL